MRKKVVPNANRNGLKEMVSAKKIDSDFNVWNVTRLLFGEGEIVNQGVNNIGFACGSPRVIQPDNFVKFPGTVEPSCNESGIIG